MPRKKHHAMALAVLGLLWPDVGWSRSPVLAAHLVLQGAKQMAATAAKPTRRTRRKRRSKRRKRAPRRWRSRLRPRSRYVRLPAGPGYIVRTPKHAFGTRLTVRTLRGVFADFHQRFPGAHPLWVHDLSKRRGGRLYPHLSHRNGRDVDIRLILKRPTEKLMQATPRTLDPQKTWYLVKNLVDTCDVDFVFLDRRLQRALYLYARKQGVPKEELQGIFQYPGKRARGIVRHSKGHADHIHVRFRAPRRDNLVPSAIAHCNLLAERELQLTQALPTVVAANDSPKKR